MVKYITPSYFDIYKGKKVSQSNHIVRPTVRQSTLSLYLENPKECLQEKPHGHLFQFLQGFLFAAISRTSFTYSFHTSYTGVIWHKESTNRFSGHSQIHRHFISVFIMTYLCCILIYSVETFDICCIVCKVNTHGFWQGSRSQACFSFHRTSVML